MRWRCRPVRSRSGRCCRPTGHLALTAGVVYRQARDEANALFDLQLRQLAAALPVRALGGIAPQALNGPAADADVVIRIWNRYGVFVYSSHPDVALPAKAQIGLTTIGTRRGDWRVFATLVDDNLLEVAQPMRVRSALAAEVALRTVAPLVILLPVLAGLLWWVVGRGLAPLRRVAEEVAAQRPAMLRPLSEDSLPREVAPLVESLNHLLIDLAAARDAQRAFIADAAHELRTPLTALQLQLQIVQRADLAADRTVAIDALRAGLLRASRLVEQLLTLARVEPQPQVERGLDPSVAGASVELVALAGEVVTLHAGLADERGIDLGLIDRSAGEAPARVDGDRDALFTLLGNLIDNALRYTPRGGRIDVVVAARGPDVVLSVIDDGPGIAADERERVFDRFHRGEAARAAGDSHGSGLGLAIVKRIGERHGAAVTLGTPASGVGLAVDIVFRAAP